MPRPFASGRDLLVTSAPEVDALSIFYGATSQLLDFSGKAWISNRELYAVDVH
jgi:hypothetical protein